jgi:hypothetical protein
LPYFTYILNHFSVLSKINEKQERERKKEREGEGDLLEREGKRE